MTNQCELIYSPEDVSSMIQKLPQDGGSNLLECKVCSKQFKSLPGITGHIKRFHSDEDVSTGKRREYVLKVAKCVEKKLLCADSPPVTVLTTKTNGEQKVNNETMTVKFNLGLFEVQSWIV